MAEKAPEDVTGLFSGLVRDDLIAAFGTLVAAGRVPKDQAASLVGGQDALGALCDLGMAQVVGGTPSSPACYQAVPVPLAMQAILTALQAKVLQQQKTLLDGQRRLVNAQALPGVGPDGFPAHQIRYITNREDIVLNTTALINSVHRDFMTLETALTDIRASEDNRIKCPQGMKRQVRVRSIYDNATLKDPAALHNLRLCVADGDEVRILPSVPGKMQLIDETAVLLPGTPTGTGGALLIYLAPITRMMKVFFELLWERATPYGAVEKPRNCPLTELQLGILDLLARDVPDGSIADALGRSASTISREIKDMKKLTGTDSRFALGVAVGRRGWFNPEKEKDA